MQIVKHFSIVCVAASVCLHAGGARAQQMVAVRGNVVDSSEAPVVGVLVELALPDGRVQGSVHSESNGTFLLTGVAPGTYKLPMPAMNGFAEQRMVLQVGRSNCGSVRCHDTPKRQSKRFIHCEPAS